MTKNDYEATMETLDINANDYLIQKLARGDQQFKHSDLVEKKEDD